MLPNAARLNARRRRRKQRWTAARLGAVVVLLLIAAAGLVVWRGASVSMPLAGLNERVASALQSQIGRNWTVAVESAALSWRGTGPALAVAGLTLRNSAGEVVLHAPEGTVAVDGVNLMVGQFRPTAISLVSLDLRVLVDQAGTLRLDDKDVGFLGGLSGGETASGAGIAASLFGAVNQLDALFGELELAELREARLILVEPGRVERLAFTDVTMAVSRAGDRMRRVEMSIDGRRGPWSISADLAGLPGEERSVAVAFRNVILADLWLFAGQTAVPVDDASAMSGSAQLRFGPAGELLSAQALAEPRGGGIGLTVGDVDRMPIERATLSVKAEDAGFAVEELRLTGGGSDLRLKGRVGRVADSGVWSIVLDGAPGGVLSGAAPHDPPVPLDEASFRSEIDTTTGVSRSTLAIRTGDATAKAIAETIPAGGQTPRVRLSVSATPIDVRRALRIWPAMAAGGTRQYLIDSLSSGIAERLTVDIDLPAEIVATFYKEQPWPDDSVKVDFSIRDASFQAAPGLPPLVGATIDGKVTATTAEIRMPRGTAALPESRKLAIQDGLMSSRNTTGRRPWANVAMRLSGRADALFALLNSEALKPVVTQPLDPREVSGEVDLRLSMDVQLGAALDPREVKTEARGTLTGLSLDNAFGTERLEGANLAVTFSQNQLSMKGEGRIAGLPSQIEVKPGAPGQPGEAVVSLVVDEAARRRRGLPAGRKLAGPVAIRATAPVGVAQARTRIEADLTRAAIEDLVPGWEKPAGRPAKISLVLGSRAGAMLLDDIVIDSATLQARGQAELKADLTPVSAEFENVRLSPGDNLAIKLTRTGAVTKLAVTGPVFDARPFLKRLQSAPAGRGRAEEAEGPDLDVEIAIPIITGFNDEAVTQGVISMSQRGREIRALRMAGRFGNAPVRLDLARDGSGQRIVLQSQDAGALLRFSDHYRRMVGGDLVVRISAFDPVQSGDVLIRDFALRDEPALNRILAQAPASARNDERLTAAPLRPGANIVEFTKLRGDFARSSARLEIRDAVMWGPLVGVNLAGDIDYGRDRVELDGTFVPAYALNNAFAQVPLFGPLLGGGATEGLFAVSFRVTGPASAPTLTINPLSFVAPGIFRKFVEAFRFDPAVTGAPPPSSAPSR